MGGAHGRTRALAVLEKGLARKDAELAVEGLLALTPPEREARLGAVVPLFREAVEAARRGRDGARLVFWAARADREPGLVGGDPAVCWALLWGCARGREWTRARRWFDMLSPALVSRAPALERALDAWLAAEGRPAPEALSGLSFREPSADPRLGREPVRPRVPPPEPPREPEEVDAPVLACCATQPWNVFATAVETWASRASSETSRRIWLLAGRLAVRELLRRLAAGERQGFEPAALLARAAGEVELPGELVGAFRALLSSLPERTLAHPEDARTLAAVAMAIARWPEHRRFVVEAVAALVVEDAAGPVVLELARQLLRQQESAPLWGLALELWGATGELPRPPEWLQASLSALLAGDNALLPWLRALSPEDREGVLTQLGLFFPAPRVGELIDRCWDGADELLRHELARMVLDRLDARAGLTGRGAGVVPERARLKPEDLALWRGCAERLLRYEDGLLEYALGLADSEPEAWQAVEYYLRGRSGIVPYLEALGWVAAGGWPGLVLRLADTMFQVFADSPAALARGFDWCVRGRLPPAIIREMARALLDSLALQPGPHGPEVERAVREAKRWGRRRSGSKTPRKPVGKNAGKKKKGGGTRKPRQVPLFGDKP
ncbi:MAG TPA: DUF6109 family natural product biosynthesis protein [Myxococcaceae bacterium]|nr:DUF6109 family natural product biosynthesis protein [Myxococcaceae bacterium]